MRRRVELHTAARLLPLLAVLTLLATPGCQREEAPAWPGDDPAGSAACTPACGAQSCGEEDGCGGRCACPHEATCLSCPLRLVRTGASDGTVTLAVESSAVAGVELPRLAELHVAADRPVRLVQVALGPSLASARKRLHRFTDTDLPWQRLADGSYRLLVFSGSQHGSVPPGRWLSLRFAPAADGQAAQDVVFRLVRRPEVLAPAAADLALQETRYDAPLLVSVGR